VSEETVTDRTLNPTDITDKPIERARPGSTRRARPLLPSTRRARRVQNPGRDQAKAANLRGPARAGPFLVSAATRRPLPPSTGGSLQWRPAANRRAARFRRASIPSKSRRGRKGLLMLQAYSYTHPQRVQAILMPASNKRMSSAKFPRVRENYSMWKLVRLAFTPGAGACRVQ
jgi:hypothetical protein